MNEGQVSEWSVVHESVAQLNIGKSEPHGKQDGNSRQPGLALTVRLRE
jgi:hypothetical protein